jgi:hypothetical protein
LRSRSIFLAIFLALFLLLTACNYIAEEPTSQPEVELPSELPPTSTTQVIWRPAPGTTWQWQLTDLPVDQNYEVEMYDLDLFENDATVVAALHAAGRVTVCYLNAGGWEEWRPDADRFPSELLGQPLDEWPGERWLDIRQLDALAPILAERLDLCQEKGFDGVEPDNVDGYSNDTGFALSYDDQLQFNRWLSEQAHARGLSIGLKNDLDQIEPLLDDFDWALNEECFYYEECEGLRLFIEAGKAVFHVEYELETGEFCDRATEMQFSSMVKRWELDAWAEPCF